MAKMAGNTGHDCLSGEAAGRGPGHVCVQRFEMGQLWGGRHLVTLWAGRVSDLFLF